MLIDELQPSENIQKHINTKKEKKLVVVLFKKPLPKFVAPIDNKIQEFGPFNKNDIATIPFELYLWLKEHFEDYIQ